MEERPKLKPWIHVIFFQRVGIMPFGDRTKRCGEPIIIYLYIVSYPQGNQKPLIFHIYVSLPQSTIKKNRKNREMYD